jgi:hypothetical protein
MGFTSCSAETIGLNFTTKSLPMLSRTPKSRQSIATLSPAVSDRTSKTALISATGIGSAQLGITLKHLKQVLGAKAKFQSVSPFMVDVDINAIAVSQSGKVQYYILYPAGTKFSDSDRIEGVLTDRPNFRTAEGVGPGTTLKQAEAIYGDVTLFYNTSNESREYVKFARQPAKNLLFRTFAPEQTFAGIYPSGSREYKETKKFQANASICSVMVTRDWE